MISSPMPTLQPYMAHCNDAVPLEHPSAYLTPCQAAYSFSNSTVTSVPDMPPRRKTSRTAFSSSLVIIGQAKSFALPDLTAFGPPNRASFDSLIFFPLSPTVQD